MEEHYSDTEHIIAGKRNDRFEQRVKALRRLILVLLSFGIGLTIFASITWNNSSNDILRSLAITGLVTIVASLIGLIGCNRCLTHFEVVKTNKMKQSPGQEALLIFFYFDFLLLCAFLLYGTWCFFYQDDATAWLEAKYADKESWERDFKGISLATVQNNLKLILTIAGSFSLAAGMVAFACIYYAMKISIFFETIHTVVQVQNLVIVLISFLIIYAGAIAKSYYQVPYVQETEPEYLPQVLIFTGVALILVAYLGFFASRLESKVGLISFTVFCVFLMLNFLIFIVLLNFGSQVLQQQFEDKCHEVMPYFHKNFYRSFGCINKYTTESFVEDPQSLTCGKEQISNVWEQNINIPLDEQTEKYGCLNEKCCIAMISFVKGKFNFLAAFCIVAFFFILVAIMTSQYMYRKVRKYNTQILSHRNDKYIFGFMVAFTVGLGLVLYFSMPEGPTGMPQPNKEESSLQGDDKWKFYEMKLERRVGLGEINDEGWLNFEGIQLFSDDQVSSKESDIIVTVAFQSIPPVSEFAFSQKNHSNVSTIDQTHGNVTIKGSIQEVSEALTDLQYRPGCIYNPSNSLELNITFSQKKRMLENIEQEDVLTTGVSRRYLFNLNLNSGKNRTYRAKLIDYGQSPSFFKELGNVTSGINVTVTTPNFKGCKAITVPVGAKGIIEFNMSTLNQTIPYLIKVQAERATYQPIVFDYFVGGYPLTDKVEMGTYSFFQQDNKTHNVSGAVFEAFSNRTFSEDYTITVYSGYGEMKHGQDQLPYEVLKMYSNAGQDYSGSYELFDLKTGAYVAVAEVPLGYIRNFQRFYALPVPPFTKSMRSLPLVPEMQEGELALVLTWGYSPRDLDIHVEFAANRTVLCKCDFSMHQCGGVKYQTDSVSGGDKGADVIKFDYVGDFQYLVYVSQFKHKSNSPKAVNQSDEATLSESQAQLKVFAPFYSWPVLIFDIPAVPASNTQNYWSVFCFDGRIGLKGLVPLNTISQAQPDVTDCHKIYGSPDFMWDGVDVSQDTQMQP